MHDDNDDSSKSDRATTWWLDWSENAQETVEYCGHKYVYGQTRWAELIYFFSPQLSVENLLSGVRFVP